MAIALCFGCSYWSSKCTINVNRVSLVELELCTIPERLSLTPLFSVWVRTNYYLWGIVWGSDHCACLTESDRKWRYQKRPFPEVTWFPPSIFSRTFFCTFSRTVFPVFFPPYFFLPYYFLFIFFPVLFFFFVFFFPVLFSRTIFSRIIFPYIFKSCDVWNPTFWIISELFF